MNLMFRQGDVLVRAVAALPDNVQVIANSERIVLAYGEVTGHAHAIDADVAQEFHHANADGVVRRFLEVFEQGASLTHEEHATIPLPPGFYEIVRQREYTPQTVRMVGD